MLVDAVLLCAPVVVAFPAVVGLLTSHVGVASKATLQKRLYATLLMAEKVPAGAVGAEGIARAHRQGARAARRPPRRRTTGCCAGCLTRSSRRAGGLFESAWLPAHYRNERTRLATHWSQLHKARDPLLRWSRNGYGESWQLDSRPSGPTSPRSTSTR